MTTLTSHLPPNPGGTWGRSRFDTQPDHQCGSAHCHRPKM